MSSKLFFFFFLPHKLFFSNRDSGLSDMYFNNVQEKSCYQVSQSLVLLPGCFGESAGSCVPPSQPGEGAARQTCLLLMKITASESVET